jgi:SAM-dependent methyltransferase
VTDGCVLCGGDQFEFLREAGDRMLRLPGKFGFERCRGCGLVRLSPRPRPEDLAYYYPRTYYTHAAPPSEDPLARGARFTPAHGIEARIFGFIRDSVLAHLGYPRRVAGWRRTMAPALVAALGDRCTYRLRGFPRWVPGGRALDVGCGSGTFLAILGTLGWAATGVEPDEDAALAGRKRYGIEVHIGELASVELPAASFDHVRLNHVLEHLLDPLGDLKRIAWLLRPGGTLYLETPNADARHAATMGEDWIGWDAPRHVQLFNNKTARRALLEAGLEVRSEATIFDELVLRHSLARRKERAGKAMVGDPRVTPMTALRAGALESLRRLGHPRYTMAGESLCVWAFRPLRGGS